MLFGFSAAAEPVWAEAGKYGDRLAAVVIVAGAAAPPTEQIEAIPKEVPICLAYGKADPVAPLEIGRQTLEALSDAGRTATLLEVEADDHFRILKEGAKECLALAGSYLKKESEE